MLCNSFQSVKNIINTTMYTELVCIVDKYIIYLCHLVWVDQKCRHIKCVLAEQFIQTANYYKKSIFSLHVATVYTSAKPQMAFPRCHKLHKSCLVRYIYNIKPLPSGLALYIVYVPSRHDLSNTHMLVANC